MFSLKTPLQINFLLKYLIVSGVTLNIGIYDVREEMPSLPLLPLLLWDICASFSTVEEKLVITPKFVIINLFLCLEISMHEKYF